MKLCVDASAHPHRHLPTSSPPLATRSFADRSTGQRYTRRAEKTVLEVMIERGMKNGQTIRFEGKGDVMPGACGGAA